jgi:hypothetical protein
MRIMKKVGPPPHALDVATMVLQFAKNSIAGNVIWPMLTASTKKSLPFRFRSIAVVFPISSV